MITCFLTFALLLIVPGWFIFSLVQTGENFAFLERIPISFSLSVGSISIVGVIAFLIGLDLMEMQYFVVFLFFSLILIGLVRWKRTQGLDCSIDVGAFRGTCSRSGIIVFCFALSCSLLAYWAGPWLSHTADAFYHLAAVQRLIGDRRLLVENVFFDYKPSGFDLTSGTWHLVLALFSSFSRIDITRIWLYLPALLTPVYILSFHAFASTLFKNRKLATFVTVLYFVLHQKLDFRVLARPNRIGLAVFWVALLFTLRYLDTGKKKYLCLASTLGFVLSTMHFFSLELFLLSIASYALFRLLFMMLKKGVFLDSDLKRALMVIVVTLVLASPFVTFKLASTRFIVGPIPPAEIRQAYSEGFRYALSLGEKSFIVDPAVLFPHPLLFKETPLPKEGARGELVVFAYLLMFFLIPACLRGKRAETFLFANMAIVPLILFNPLLLHFILGRVPDLAIFRLAYEMPPSVLVFGFFLYRWFASFTHSEGGDFTGARRGEWWKSRLLTVLLIGISLFCAILSFLGGPVVGGAAEIYNPFSTYKYSVKVSREGRLVNWEEPFSFIMNELPKDALVLSDPVSSYYISGLTGRFIITVPLTHQEFEYEFILLKGPEGRRDVMSVLDQDVDLKTTVSLLRKWDADYIFVDLTAPGVAALSPQSKFDRYSSNFQKIYDRGDVSIYRYDPSVPFASWDAVASAISSDPNVRVSADMVLASFSLDEEPIEPNRCAAFTLDWKPLREIEENRQVQFRFAGVNSGYVFSEPFDLVEDAVLAQHSWKPGDVYEETYFVFIAGDLPLDAYDVSIGIGGEGTTQKEVALGRIRLKESYEGKDFEGLTDFCESCPGWMRNQNYAVARDLGATMSKSIRPIPAGDYQVLLTVYDHQGQGSNQVKVTLNGVSRVVEWSGTKEGEREVGAVFEGQDGGSELTITSLQREQWYIVVSEVAIVPLMEER